MNYNLTVGISLNDRTIYLNVPDETTITESKNIVTTDKGNYIVEDSTGGYYSYTDSENNEVTEYFFNTTTNLSEITLPEDFGTIIEIDDTATLYEYISRTSHEKKYVISEDFDKSESMDKDSIKAEVEEQVRGYGVAVGSVMGFDGPAADIPGGYIVTDDEFSGGSGDNTPIGQIIEFAGSVVPNGYLLCDGSAVSRTDYADLFDVIGTSYGTGDGSTTFNLPNKKGRVGVGLDTNDTDFDTLGETIGEKTHTLTVDELPSHSHRAGTNKSFLVTGSTYNYQTGSDQTNAVNITQASTAETGSGEAHNNIQPSIVFNYAIKATTVVNVIGRILNTYNESNDDVYSSYYINQTVGNIGSVLDLINGESV